MSFWITNTATRLFYIEASRNPFFCLIQSSFSIYLYLSVVEISPIYLRVDLNNLFQYLCKSPPPLHYTTFQAGGLSVGILFQERIDRVIVKHF